VTTFARLSAFTTSPEARPALLGFLGATMISSTGSLYSMRFDVVVLDSETGAIYAVGDANSDASGIRFDPK